MDSMVKGFRVLFQACLGVGWGRYAVFWTQVAVAPEVLEGGRVEE